MEPANHQLQRLKFFISPLYLANTAYEKAYLLKGISPAKTQFRQSALYQSSWVFQNRAMV